MYENRNFMIFSTSETGSIDFLEVLETSSARRGVPSIGAYLNSNIYNATIYNRALSSQEVLQNYNATKGRFGL